MLNTEIVVTYKYGYLDKVTEVNRRGEITKYDYDGFGMLSQKTFADGSTEIWVWDGMTLLRRGDDIYINEPHASGGVPIASKTDKGVRFHEHDFLGTTLWSFDLEGKIVDDYQDTTVFGEGSIQHDRAARFTGKPYDKEMGAYIFPYRNYDPTTMRWRSADPSGYPDGINNQFYACVPTMSIDPLGLAKYDKQHGSVTFLTTWTEYSSFSLDSSFTVSFPLSVTLNVDTDMGWEHRGGYSTVKILGTHPELAVPRAGWKWTNELIAQDGYTRTDTVYDRGYYSAPIYDASGLIITGYTNVENDYRTCSFETTIKWIRQIVEI